MSSSTIESVSASQLAAMVAALLLAGLLPFVARTVKTLLNS
ncbi:hypothetical protein [Cryobacterium sp. PH29-G1]|nr:hypothetical protein [Cryobacterium sp. PH29-G1]MDJ0349543.1 hypothetical protein [Cryobacterium sp. PH29-G1]